MLQLFNPHLPIDSGVYMLLYLVIACAASWVCANVGFAFAAMDRADRSPIKLALGIGLFLVQGWIALAAATSLIAAMPPAAPKLAVLLCLQLAIMVALYLTRHRWGRLIDGRAAGSCAH